MTVTPFGFFWRRSNLPPLTRQPLAVRSVAHARFGAFHQEDARTRDYPKLQWTIDGTAEIRLGGRLRRVAAGDVTFWSPDSEHWARAGERGWSCWWFTLLPDAASWPLLEACGLTEPATWHGDACPQAVFRELAAAVSAGTADGEELAASIAYRLLVRAARHRRTRDRGGAVDEALAEIARRWADPDFGVKELAERLAMHRSRLCRQFARAVGMPPSDYLLRLRLQRAAALLRTARGEVQRVAARCGFADASYFARSFRRAYGRSPSEHREDPGS